LLAKIAEEASAIGWISVNVNADTGMLDEIMIQIKDKASEFLSPESLSYIASYDIEMLMDEADKAADASNVRHTHEEVFSRLKDGLNE